jgi:DNA-damage-inducible protein D
MQESRLATTTNIFETIKRIDEEGYEYWFARELMPLLGYAEWRNFHKVILKAKKALEAIYPQSGEHFVEVNQKYKIAPGRHNEGSGEKLDYKLSRRACYLIAQNGDAAKDAIAQAQNYFAQQTRKQEVLEEREKHIERILARRKLSETEKKFAGVLAARGIDGRGIAEIKSAGDAALFGHTTKQVKQKLGIKEDTPLADHLPTISIKAKDLATEMTTFKAQKQNIYGKDRVKFEHASNNSAVRKMLSESSIYPEQLPAEEDVKNLEKKYSEEDIKEVEEHKLLATDILEIDIIGVFDMEELAQIKSVIDNNQGNSKLRIYYGSEEEKLTIERDIQINPDVINALSKYLVITDNAAEV